MSALSTEYVTLSAGDVTSLRAYVAHPAEKPRAAKKTYVNVEFSDAGHGFFCDARGSYNAAAAAQAWPLTLAFLSTHLAAHTRSADA